MVIAYLFVYIMIPAILLMGVRKRIKTINLDNVLEFDFSDSCKGFFAVYIAIHHYVLQMENTGKFWLLNNIGFLCVAWFFFMSGYGLTKSWNKSNNSGNLLEKWLWKRFIRIYISFVITNLLIGILYNIFLNAGYSIFKIIGMSMMLRAVYSETVLWYIAVQLLLYLLFAIATRVPNGESGGIFNLKNAGVLTCCVLIYIILSVVFRNSIWKYNTVLCFCFGVFFSIFEKRITEFWAVHRKYRCCLCGVSVMVFFLVMGALDFLLFEEKIKNLLTVIIALLFVWMLINLSYVICIHSNVYLFIGKRSYEFYLLQLPIIYICRAYINNCFIGILLTLIVTISCAVVCKIIADRIISLILK